MLRTRVHYEQAEIKRRSRQAEIKHRSRKLPTAYRLHEMKNKSCKYFEYWSGLQNPQPPPVRSSSNVLEGRGKPG
jgi:hypothetical protein